MSVDLAELATEITDVGLALGLLTRTNAGTPELNGDFFADPAGAVAGIVADPGQRAALLDALQTLVPGADPVDGVRRHPLVVRGGGKLWLTVRKTGSRTALGLAAEMRSGDAAVTVDLPLLAATGSIATATAATGDAPLALRVRLPLPTGGRIVASLLFVAEPLSATRFVVRFEPESGPPLELDPLALPDALGRLVASLLTTVLATGDQDAPPAVVTLAEHLPALLGLDDGLPEFPFGGGEVRGWLRRLAATRLDDGRTALDTWLSHLGALLDAPVTGPLTLTLAETPVRLDLLVSVRDDKLLVTLRADVRETLAGEAVLLVLPLAGDRPPTLLDRLDLAVHSNADMLYQSGDLHIRAARAGLRYDGTTTTPLLELTDVALGDAGTFPVLDLADTHALTTAARTALENAIRAGLGDAGGDLLVLIGIGQSPSVDTGLLATAPARAIADYYERLRTAGGGWRRLLAAASRLLGTPEPGVEGGGTRDDPWRVSLAHLPAPGEAEPTLSLTLWDDDSRPRLGLRLGASAETWRMALDSELLAGRPAGWFGRQSLRIEITPPSTALVSASGLVGTLAWAPGEPLTADVRVRDLTVTVDGESVPLGDLSLPADPAAPDDPALGLGIDADALWRVVRLLLGRALESWAGVSGVVLATLVGLGRPAEVGLPADLPPLPLPVEGDLRSLLDNPAGAFREWLRLLTGAATGLSASGLPLLDAAREPLQALLTDHLPAFVGIGPAPEVPPAGSGAWGDPWTVPLQEAGDPAVELLAWLDPDGPPLEWGVPAAEDTAEDEEEVPLPPPSSRDIIDAYLALAPYLEDSAAVDADDPATAAGNLNAAILALQSTDGLVPVDATFPATEDWSGEVLSLACAHHLLPGDPDVAVAIRDRAAGLPAGTVTVLLAPALAGPDCWRPYLDLNGITDAQTVDLRVPGIDPADVDLGAVSAATHYVVNLADDGTRGLDDIVAQLDRVLTRIGGRFLLVAHSYTGLVGWHWTAAHPGRAAGLVLLGAPLTPVELLDESAADGVRLIRRLAPALTGPADDALTFLSATLDGFPAPFPAAAFRRGADPLPGLGDVPVLAIGGVLDENLTDLVKDEVDRLAAVAPVPADATHIGYGVRLGLPLPAAAGNDPPVTATLRLDLGSAALIPDLAPAPQPLTRLLFTAAVGNASTWILGGPGNGTTRAARARSVEIAIGYGSDDELGVAGGFAIRMYDAALGGAEAPVIDLDDPQGVPLLAAIIAELDRSAVPGGRVRALLDALTGIGLLTPAGLSADVLQALRDDPVGYLAPLLPGVLGMSDDGTWRAAPGALPVELLVERDPWRVTVRTTGDGLHTAGTGRLVASGSVRLGDMAATTTGRLSVAGLSLSTDRPGTLDVTAPWLDAPLRLVPANPAAIRAALAPLVPRLLVDAGLTVLLEELIGDGTALASLSSLLARPADWLLGPDGFGDGVLPRPDEVNEFLGALADAAGLDTSETAPLVLPGGFVLAASRTPAGVRLGVSTPEPLDLDGLTIAIAAHADVDRTRHATPGGEVSIRLPLPAGAGWASVGLRLGADPAGLALAVDLSDEDGTRTVRLLPEVSGLADLLAAGAARLLPAALDTLVNGLPDTAVKRAALDVATALEIYDPALAPNGFANPAGQAHLMSIATDRPGLTTVVNRLLGLLLPDIPIPAGKAGVTLAGYTLAADLDTTPPAVELTARGLRLGVVTADATLAYGGSVTANVRIGAVIDTGKGVVLSPRFDAYLRDGKPNLDLRPLGGDDLVLKLAPEPVAPTLAQVARLAEHWAVPLAANVVVDALAPWLDRPVWSSAGKTVRGLLTDAGLIDPNGHLRRVPLPGPAELAVAGLRALRGLPVRLGDDLTLPIDEDGGLIGVRLAGRLELTDGFAVDFGLPAEIPVAWPGRGATLFLLDTATTRPVAVLRLAGAGVAMTGSPLVDASVFRLGAAGAYLRTDLVFTGPDALRRAPVLDGAVLLTGLGLPIGSGAGSANPVAASLLRRAPGDDGDDAPVNPPLNLLVATVDGQRLVRFDGKASLELPVRESLGPLYVDGVEIDYQSDPAPGKVGAGITGGVRVGPLDLGVRDLRLLVPLRSPADLDTWGLDLGGLALQWDAGPVSLSGGLGKTVAEDGTVTYDGQLAATVAGRRLAAVGSYAQMRNYPSLFIFLSYPFPLGGPPYFYVLGVAAGAGYNRRLTPPRDPAGVPAFPLVAALAGASPDNPVAALTSLSRDMPPRRGSYWIAAGLNFTTFGLLHSTALAYAALDRGTEVGLLGLSRLALPPDDDAKLVSVELALAAHFSTVDQVLSVRAALTRNSWLISRDCQLTGGFALIAWLNKPDVLLTIGGYHPRFVRPPEYPEVERVGFRWEVGHGVVVKGESYLAILHSGLMFGGSLEASYTASWVRLWFRAGLDVMLFWDPLRYEVDAFVSIGAAVRFRVCFIACVTISFSVSIGARLSLQGPPLHGTVTVDLAVASVTVEFGSSVLPPFLTWPEILVKYLSGGDAARPVTNGVVTAGLRPGETGPVALLAPVFRLRFESTMPASAWRMAADTADRPSTVPAPAFVNAVPAGGHLKPLRGVLVLAVDRRAGDQWLPVPAAQLAHLTPATTGASFPASLWSTTPSDPQHDQPALARVDMLGALGGLELAGDSTTREATGALGDHAQLSLARLVEEETPRPLPLPARALAAGRRARREAAPALAAAAVPDPGPTLRSVSHPAGPRAWRSANPAPAAANGFAGTSLPAGATQLWDLAAPAAAARLGVSGAGDVRAIALSATGAPLGVRHLPVRDGTARRFAPAPEGTARLAVRRAAGPAGWDLRSTLLPVASGTLLANDAVVLTATPFRPPARYRGTEVPAVLVSTTQPQLTTVLPGDCREVLIHLDRRAPGAGLGDLRVTCTPDVLDGPELLTTDARVTLRYRVRGEADQISVAVVSAADWYLAGVIGTPATTSRAQAGAASVSVLPSLEEKHG